MNVISNKIGNRMFFGNSRVNNNDRNNSEEFTGFSQVLRGKNRKEDYVNTTFCLEHTRTSQEIT